MSDFFYYFKRKNRSFLEVFETKGGGEGGSFAIVSKRQNMSDFYFASIPKELKHSKHRKDPKHSKHRKYPKHSKHQKHETPKTLITLKLSKYFGHQKHGRYQKVTAIALFHRVNSYVSWFGLGVAPKFVH